MIEVTVTPEMIKAGEAMASEIMDILLMGMHGLGGHTAVEYDELSELGKEYLDRYKSTGEQPSSVEYIYKAMQQW